MDLELVCAFVGVAFSAAGTIVPQSYRLSAPLPGDADVDGALLSADGRTAVFAGGAQLYSVGTDGKHAPVLLSTAGQIVSAFSTNGSENVQISPDGRWVVYPTFSGFGPTRARLYAVPIDGSAAPLELDRGGDPHRAVRFTPDGLQVVFLTQETPYPFRSALARVPVDGSAAPVTLASTTDTQIESFQLTPDGGRAVFVKSQFSYSVPVDGSAAPVLLGSKRTVPPPRPASAIPRSRRGASRRRPASNSRRTAPRSSSSRMPTPTA